MADNKTPLTDAEIKTLLECCLTANCDICPSLFYGSNPNMDCRSGTISIALDLINRLEADKEALIAGQETLQKALADKNAEIEKLKNECFCIANERDAIKDCINIAVEEAKAEAVKEFAEKLKERAKETVVYKNELCVMGVPFVNVKDIDSLVKEMVGES